MTEPLDSRHIPTRADPRSSRVRAGLDGREAHPRGVTFLESLVAVVVAIVFLAVAIPGVEAAREASRRNRCAANQAAVAGAVLARHEAHGRFPDGIGFTDSGCRAYTGRMLWTFTMLPYLGHEEVADSIGPDTWGAGPATGDSMRGFRATIPVYRCPSDTHATVTDPSLGTVDHTRANVVACFSPHGFAVEPEADPVCLANHQMHGGERTLDNPTVLSIEPFLTRPGRALFNVRGVPRSLESVTDGTSRTLMLSETISGEARLDFRGMWWADQGVQFSCWRTPNHPGEDSWGGNGAVPVRSAKAGLPDIAVRPGGWPALLAAARSRHGGLVNAAFVDGSVRPVRDDVAPETWTALGSIDGADDDEP